MAAAPPVPAVTGTALAFLLSIQTQYLALSSAIIYYTILFKNLTLGCQQRL